MEKRIPIPTDKSKFFRQYLEILNPILKLRPKELDVLSELLYHNNELKNIPEIHRWKLIFGADTKAMLCKRLDLSSASLNNNLSALRHKKIIVNNKVQPSFLIYPGDAYDLVFNFKLNASED